MKFKKCGKKKAIKKEKQNGVSDAGSNSKPKISGQETINAGTKDVDLMEKILGIMEQQTKALSEMAKTSQTKTAEMEKIADARFAQALAIEKAVDSFVNVGTSLYDIQNAITSVDHTLQRYYSVSIMNNRQQSNIFNQCP